jgi:hypothetical protein
MSNRSTALHLWCDACDSFSPHRAVSAVSVECEYARTELDSLRKHGYHSDEPLSEFPARSGYVRGRQCTHCNEVRLTVEVDASSLVSLLRSRDRMKDASFRLKEIGKLRREIAATLKKINLT